MTLLEFAEKTSPIPLMEWQKVFLQKYEEAKREGKELIFNPGRVTGRKITADIINKFYQSGMNEFRCIKCNKLLAMTDNNSKVEIVCPKCKTKNNKDREPQSTSS